MTGDGKPWSVRAYPKTRLRRFSNPSMPGRIAGVRGFSDTLLVNSV